MFEQFVSLDLETTGISAEKDRIIEVGAIRFNRERVIETFEESVNPGRAVPLRIERLTGIRSLDLVAAPNFDGIREKLRRFIGDSPIVGQNIYFDISFLKSHGMEFDPVTLDTFELASVLMPDAPRHNLAGLAKYFGVEQKAAHRALDDAETARRVFLGLLDKADQLDLKVLSEINRLMSQVSWRGREVLVDIERERSRTIFVDEATPSRAPSARTMPGSRLNPVSEPEMIDGEALADIFSAGGALAESFPDYEVRPGQIAMMRQVAAAFNGDQHLVVEAGTGIGKSIAYLLPAIMYAVKNQCTVVVSTNTLNLQDQLLKKDVPVLLRALEAAGVTKLGDTPLSDVRVTQLKGRTNYLCLRRWGGARRQTPESVAEARVLGRMAVWAPNTETGDRGELNLIHEEGAVWARISAQRDNCLSSDCSHLRNNSCFLASARKRAEAAHIVITNHALLLADLAGEGRILPEYDRLIIDEAHHLEDQATSQFGGEVSQGEVLGLISQIQDVSPGPVPAGLAAELESISRMGDLLDGQRTVLHEAAEALSDQVGRAATATRELFDLAAAYATANRSRDQERRFRLHAEARQQPRWANVEIAWERLEGPLLDCARWLKRSQAELAEVDTNDFGDLALELSSLALMLERVVEILAGCIAIPDAEEIYWLSLSLNDDAVTFAVAPLEVAPILEEKLFATKSTVVMTSATLSAGESTDYFRNRVGAIESEEMIVPPPFDYKTSTLLTVPTDIPEPNQSGHQAAIEQAFTALVKASNGRALALFTSHSAIRTTYRACREALTDDDILPLAQGIDGSPQQIMAAFQENPRSVILGTSSFWEGIDVVGDDLSLVIIIKLPFAVPTDPIVQARSELFNRPFDQYAVPQAIIRFKQGFGRLIRSASDRGVVAVLDRRIESKRYGRLFLEALPECTTLRSSTDDIAAAAAAWLKR